MSRAAGGCFPHFGHRPWARRSAARRWKRSRSAGRRFSAQASHFDVVAAHRGVLRGEIAIATEGARPAAGKAMQGRGEWKEGTGSMATVRKKTISRRMVEALKVGKDTVFWDSELAGFGKSDLIFVSYITVSY